MDKTIERQNHRAAWRYFENHGYADHHKMVLHHTDLDMKAKDPDRYAQWRPEDLIPMTIQDHRRLHMAIQNPRGKRLNKAHLQHVRESAKTRMGKKSKIVRVTAKSGEVKYFMTYAAAAAHIGCSRALVSQCLNAKQPNRSACGYKIEIFKKI